MVDKARREQRSAELKVQWDSPEFREERLRTERAHLGVLVFNDGNTFISFGSTVTHSMKKQTPEQKRPIRCPFQARPDGYLYGRL